MTTLYHIETLYQIDTPLSLPFSLIDTSCMTQTPGSFSKQRILKGLGVYLFVAFSITIICCLLHCAGDVETNPGPGSQSSSYDYTLHAISVETMQFQ